MSQEEIVENPFYVRPARRVNTYAAAKAKRRRGAEMITVDFEKVDRRFMIYGETLAAFLILQEWNPKVKIFYMGEGRWPVTDSDALDQSAPVIVKLVTDAEIWTTCCTVAPSTERGMKRMKVRELEAQKNGAVHRIFTQADGIAQRPRLENYVQMNAWLHRVPRERFDCRLEAKVIRDALRAHKTTTLDYLLRVDGVSDAKMHGTVARLLHSGDLEAVVSLDKEVFGHASDIRWVECGGDPSSSP
ncbi:hypothetical protein [Paraburkholderia sp. 32]|uniref:hypothetical protein n=1 Tax=Paraburkholderia sp. 32 TaxID=2991057 RepID=UPI003D1EAF70